LVIGLINFLTHKQLIIVSLIWDLLSTVHNYEYHVVLVGVTVEMVKDVGDEWTVGFR
jgi:hypothetical protein